jgi:hypothetical protein
MKSQNSKLKIQKMDEKGIALVMVMVLSLIALAIVSALLFMLTQGTRESGAYRFFKTAEEASIGGTEIASQFIRSRGKLNLPTANNPWITTDACLNEKLTLSKTDWTSNCSATEKSLGIIETDNTTFDMSFDLGDYRVYAKIVDTVQGNSDTGGIVTSGSLGGGGVVASNSGIVSPPHVPYLYRMEIQAQKILNPVEHSRLAILYAY